MTAAVETAWHTAPCVRRPWLFHSPDFGRKASPQEALELCAVCPVLDACRLLPPPEVPGKWAVQAGNRWDPPSKPKKETAA